MKQILAKGAFLVLAVTLLTMPLQPAYGAGGRIEGKVIDPKGAIVVGATVTVTDQATNQIFTVIADKEGHYKIDGLPAGTYSVVVSAAGVSDSRHHNVKVEDTTVATVDAQLEIAPVQAAV